MAQNARQRGNVFQIVLIAWVIFLALFVLMAQIAPVVLFPIFYKFSPLDNDELKSRLRRLRKYIRE